MSSAVDDLLAQAGVRFAYLFGSQTTGRVLGTDLVGRLRGPGRDAQPPGTPEVDGLRVGEAIITGLPDLDSFAEALAQQLS